MADIKLMYFDEILNFGDELNPVLLKEIFNQKVNKGRFFNSDMVMIGSMLEPFLYEKTTYKILSQKYKNKPIHIFGTGFLKPPTSIKEKFRRKAVVHAVRGKTTQKRLELLLKKDLSEIVLGDPGLLCSKLLHSRSAKKYTLGIVPHYVDKNSFYVKDLANAVPNSKILDIQSHPFEFLEILDQCELVVSSAMHGLIAADSLGIPNMRMILSQNISGGDYKFDDYYSVFNISNHKKIDFFSQSKIIDMKHIPDFISESYTVAPEKVLEINDELMSAFPKTF